MSNRDPSSQGRKPSPPYSAENPPPAWAGILLWVAIGTTFVGGILFAVRS